MIIRAFFPRQSKYCCLKRRQLVLRKGLLLSLLFVMDEFSLVCYDFKIVSLDSWYFFNFTISYLTLNILNNGIIFSNKYQFVAVGMRNNWFECVCC